MTLKEIREEMEKGYLLNERQDLQTGETTYDLHDQTVTQGQFARMLNTGRIRAAYFGGTPGKVALTQYAYN